MSGLAYFLLPLLLVATGVFFVRDVRQYRQFKALTESGARIATYRRWIVEGFLLYGLGAVVSLIAIGQLSALVSFPTAMVEVQDSIRSVFSSRNGGGFEDGLLQAVRVLTLPLLLVGSTVGALIGTYLEYKSGVRRAHDPNVRDIDALFPRNAAERRWTAALSINAGLTEEIFFRVLAPLLVWSVTGSVWGALVGATVWFALAHSYQGWGGVLTTGILGAVLMAVYVYTGSLWLVVLIHAVLDLNHLAIAPWFMAHLRRRENRAASATAGG